VQAVLDHPVPADEVGQPGGAGLGVGEAGDRVDDHGAPSAGAKVADLAGDLQDLGGVREAEVVDGDGLEGAQLDPAVRLVAGAVPDGDVVPGQGGAAVQQRGLVGLDHEQVVGLLAGDQELGTSGVGVQRIGGDHHPVKVQAAKQWLEAGDSPGAPSTWRWASTARLVWSIAASRWTWRPSAAHRAPRSVLPSTARARRRPGP